MGRPGSAAGVTPDGRSALIVIDSSSVPTWRVMARVQSPVLFSAISWRDDLNPSSDGLEHVAAGRNRLELEMPGAVGRHPAPDRLLVFER